MNNSKAYQNIVVVFIAALFLSIYAFYNAFPLIFPDSMGYISHGFNNTIPENRPVFYSLFVRHISLNETLWLLIHFYIFLFIAVLLNAIIVAALSSVYDRYQSRGASLLSTVFTSQQPSWLFLFPGMFLFWMSWKAVDFAALSPRETLRIVVPAIFLLMGGVQVVQSNFFMSFLELKNNR